MCKCVRCVSASIDNEYSYKMRDTLYLELLRAHDEKKTAEAEKDSTCLKKMRHVLSILFEIRTSRRIKWCRLLCIEQKYGGKGKHSHLRCTYKCTRNVYRLRIFSELVLLLSCIDKIRLIIDPIRITRSKYSKSWSRHLILYSNIVIKGLWNLEG